MSAALERFGKNDNLDRVRKFLKTSFLDMEFRIYGAERSFGERSECLHLSTVIWQAFFH